VNAPPALASHLIAEPEAAYALRRKDHLTSHRLAEFRRNPLLYFRKSVGLVTEEDRPAFAIGRAIHCRVLEGHGVLFSRYAVGGPVNPRSGKTFGVDTKAFAEWATMMNKPVISDETATLCEQVAEAVDAHDEARALLSEGQAEGVVRTMYAGLPSQGRLDWVHPTRGISDLKTCENLEWLESDSRNFGYVHQLAFYRALLATVSGVTVPVHIIAVEKREPFRVGVWRLSDQVLAAATRDNLAAVERLKWCRREERWPTGYEAVRILDTLS
jgi:hypothetical protein